VFFTDDEGVYLFETRDAPALVEQTTSGPPDLDAILDAHRGRIRKLSDDRLYIPAEEPYMEGHNTWCANRPGSTLLIPVGDIAQHMIAVLCFMVQNGYGLYDDVNGEQIPGLERFAHLVDLEEPLPLTFMETYSITECTAELSTSCYAGMLMLQAMGLGGWMFDGIDRYTVLGASGDPEVPGLGFRYDTDERWPLPNPTGLPGVFAGYCPPHYPDMWAAVEAFAERSGPQRGVQGVRREHGSVHLRSLREVPRHRPEHLHPNLLAGSPPGAGVLRPPLWTGGVPANTRRPHGPLAWGR
jgi:hypothetical protein